MNGFIGTRAEREWLSTVRRIADALERLADALEEQTGAPDRHKDGAAEGVHHG